MPSVLLPKVSQYQEKRVVKNKMRKLCFYIKPKLLGVSTDCKANLKMKEKVDLYICDFGRNQAEKILSPQKHNIIL